jgi:ribosomal protein L11 methyltransferase
MTSQNRHLKSLYRTDYLNIHLSINEEIQDLAIGIIASFPFSGIEQRNDQLIITFPEKEWDENTRKMLLDSLSILKETILITKEELILDKNWNEEWEQNIQPTFVSDRICISPSWKSDEINSEIKIIIDPKMSFGTGDHATTRLMCRYMEKIVKKGDFWIDVGCGTGVLAILAIKLGAEKVLAFDNNIWAIENARENFALNGVADKIELLPADIDTLVLPSANGIAANLFLHLVLPSLGKFRRSLLENNGELLISGILKYDEDIVLKEASKNELVKVNINYEDEWACFHFKTS